MSKSSISKSSEQCCPRRVDNSTRFFSEKQEVVLYEWCKTWYNGNMIKNILFSCTKDRFLLEPRYVENNSKKWLMALAIMCHY